MEKEKETTEKKNEKKLNRYFLLNKNVSSDSVQPIIDGIIAVNEKDKDVPVEEREPIKVVVDSYGGSIYCGATLANVMRTSKTPVHTYVYGKAMSMGFILSQAGHKRFIHSDAVLMYHDASTTIAGTMEEIKIYSEQVNRVIERFDKLVVERTNISQERLNEVKKERKDWYIFGDEAITLGLADEELLNTI